MVRTPLKNRHNAVLGKYSDGRSINCTTCEAGYYCPNTKGKVPVFKRCELLWSIHYWRTDTLQCWAVMYDGSLRSINCTAYATGYFCPNTNSKVLVSKRWVLLLSVHHWRIDTMQCWVVLYVGSLRSINCTPYATGYFCPNADSKVLVPKRWVLLFSVHHWMIARIDPNCLTLWQFSWKKIFSET